MIAEDLHNLFISDKSDWFIEVDNNNKIWSVPKTYHFWEMVRIHKIEKGDFHFNNFVFPTFLKPDIGKVQGNNFYEEIFGAKSKLIAEKVKFDHCRFQGSTVFYGNAIPTHLKGYQEIIFSNDLTFEHCTFDDEFSFIGTKILGNLYVGNCVFVNEFVAIMGVIVGTTSYSNCTFHKRFIYQGITQKKNVHFTSNIFNGDSSFAKCHYNEIFSLNDNVFNHNSSIFENTYHDRSTFAHLTFNGKMQINSEKYLNNAFQDIYLNGKHSLFQEITSIENNRIIFRNIIFPNNTDFRNCDCSSFLFTDSDIVNVKFSSCDWNISDRLVVRDEIEMKEKSILKLRSLENLYRQLKKNFDFNKDWELSGLAYISEMEMRKLRLQNDKKYFHYFIYWFYGFFGGYTQDVRKPILSLFFVFIICSYIYFYMDFNIINAFERGIMGSLPYLENSQKDLFPNYWVLLKNIQFIFSTIFLSFFILALRKIFKQ